MTDEAPFVTYLELRESDEEGEARAGLSHSSAGLVLLHVLELAAQGEPRGAITIVHDAGEHGGRYMELAHRLAREGWAVALPDLRGHGRSEGERGHSAGIKELLRDLGDVQDHLAYRQPEARKVLMGHGLGALYAHAYACERPDGIAALVLSAPLFAPQFEAPDAGRGLAKLFRRVNAHSPGKIGFRPEALTSAAGELAARAADELVHDTITLGAAERVRSIARAYRERIAELAMPVLVLHGGDDAIATPASAGELRRPNVEHRIFAGLRHDLFHETRKGEVIDAVAQWLAAHVASS